MKISYFNIYIFHDLPGPSSALPCVLVIRMLSVNGVGMVDNAGGECKKSTSRLISQLKWLCNPVEIWPAISHADVLTGAATIR